MPAVKGGPMHAVNAVFATDAPNRQNSILPIAGLVGAIETHLDACGKAGLPVGLPVNIAHDRCRPIGWNTPQGVYIASDMARQVGRIWYPDTDDDREALGTLIAASRQRYRLQETEAHHEALEARLADLSIDQAALWHVEAAGAIAPDLAARLAPDFFSEDSPLVDKDGLVDYAELRARTRLIEPGVFHDSRRDILFFAHPYFRRGQSRENSLNRYVMQSFHDTATDSPAIRARLRLDPDLIGVPGSEHPVMELEWWGGPRFNDDLAKIPVGVTEHKSSESERFFSQIDRTQIWWKEPETRSDPGRGNQMMRTLEIEELVDAPSPGLDDDHYGCRYAHAEFDIDESIISHFDGAIRAYDGNAFLERIERRIDRAGKNADYTKLFRFDGPLSVPAWKRILSDYYRGNHLVPEYLGAPADDHDAPGEADQASLPAPRLPDLSAFIGLDLARETPSPATRTIADEALRRGDRLLDYAEIGHGPIAEPLGGWTEIRTTAWASLQAPIVNLARIALPGDPPAREDWVEVADTLAGAIMRAADNGDLEHVSLAIEWQAAGVATILSLAGRVQPVADLLRDAATTVRPEEPASTWVEDFRDALVARAPALDAPVDWPTSTVTIGKIILPRADGLKITLRIPESKDDWLSAFADDARGG